MALVEGIDKETAIAFVQEIAKTLVPAVEAALGRQLDPVLQQVQGLREEIAALPLSLRDAILPLIDRLEAAGRGIVKEVGDQVDGLSLTNIVNRGVAP